MLPGIRLIAITFCFGFLVVLAGLRLATSVNGLHKAMPVMAAHAAPVTVGAIADRELRRGQTAVPVMYDLRFAVSTAVPATGGARATIDRIPSLMMPLVILPSAAPKPETPALAALAPRASPELAPPPRFDIPLLEPAPVDLTWAQTSPQQSKAKAPDSAALAAPLADFDLPLPEPAPIDLSSVPPAMPEEQLAIAAGAPQSAPYESTWMLDIPSPDPATIDLSFPRVEPPSDAGQENYPETDARSKSSPPDISLVVAALPAEVLQGTVKLPTRRIPVPKARAGVETTAVPTRAKRAIGAEHQIARQTTVIAYSKPKPRRKVIRATAQNNFDSLFGFRVGLPQ